MSNKSRSPLKDRPLHNPGQSIEDQIQNTLTDLFFGPVAFAVILVAVAAIEWWRYFNPTGPMHIHFTVLAIIVLGYAGYRLRRAWPHIRALKLARDGEKIVGQSLESLRDRGYQVFHDVIGNGFNLDHVLIGIHDRDENAQQTIGRLASRLRRRDGSGRWFRT